MIRRNKKKIAENVSAEESQRIIREHKDDNPTLVEKAHLGMPTGEFDVYIEIEEEDDD